MWYSNNEMKKIMSYFGIMLCAFMLAIYFSCTQIVSISAEIGQQDNPLHQQLIVGGEESDGGIFSFFESLTNAEISRDEIEYYENGVKKKSASVIKKAVTDYFLEGKQSSGNGVYNLSEDLRVLSNTDGISLFVKANLGLLALSPNEKDKVDFYILAGENKQQTTSNQVYQTGAYIPEFVETENIEIKNIDQIEFGFQTKEKQGQYNEKGFLIFNPKLIFSVNVNNINLVTQSKEVFVGEKIRLNATNSISNLNGGEIISYLKEYFKIEWEIIEGSDLATINDDVLSVNGESGTIRVRAKCYTSTQSDEYIYSDILEFNINNKYGVSVVSNFTNSISDIQIEKVGNFYKASLKINDGFSFYSVESNNNQELTTSLEGNVLTIENINYFSKTALTVNLKKELKITDVIIKEKIYNKQNDASVLSIITNKELHHNLTIDGVVATFENIDAGVQNVIISGQVTLSGEDANLYYLSNSMFLEDGTIIENSISKSSTIYPKQIVVKALQSSKQFGDSDGELLSEVFGILEGDNLQGSLTREIGEKVGKYRILQGDYGKTNNNYKIDYQSTFFEITKRQFEITKIQILDREYDKTTTITQGEPIITEEGNEIIYKNGYLVLTYNKNSVVAGYDKIEILATAEYLTYNAQDNKTVNLSLFLSGADRDYYEFIYPKDVTGNIKPKSITITADDKVKQFGDTDPELTYTINGDGLLAGDYLSGYIVRDSSSNYLGVYDITIGSLGNPNYQINFINGKFEIVPRNLSIEVDPIFKSYLSQDPEFKYKITNGNIVDGYDLNLVLEREEGELVGEYLINIVSNNEVYKIVDYNPSTLTIQPRRLGVNITVLEKEYDGTNLGIIQASYENLPTNNPDGVKLNELIVAKFQETIVGIWPITYYLNDETITEFSKDHMKGLNLNCYDFNFTVQQESEIKVRNISIKILCAMQKQYGYADPNFNNYQIINGFENIRDYLTGNIEREPGEEVGSYNVLLGTLNNENNPNFNISFYSEYIFRITKRIVLLDTVNNTKVYGEQDPEIEFSLSETTPLPSGVVLGEILLGKPSREPGEDVGIYNHTLGSLKIVPEESSRYEIKLNNAYLEITKRKLTIEIENKVKTYGDLDPNFKFRIILGTLAKPEDLVLVREEGENAGSYVIFADINKNNYDFEENIAKLTINKANITIGGINCEKIYGDLDPIFEIELVDGSLKFDDRLDLILTGTLGREEGEDVGVYKINIGTVTSNGNYNLSFKEEAVLTITKRHIEVTANPIKMFLDEMNPNVTPSYTVTPNLYFNDELNGELEVEPITGVGSFKISIGTLNHKNYEITFVENYVFVVKRKLLIESNSFIKSYDGTNIFNPAENVFNISGDIKEGHDENYFGISYQCNALADAGIYPIIINYSNKSIDEFYDVEIVNGFFIIEKANVIVTAKGQELIYGEKIPTSEELEYEIEGTIYEDDFKFNLVWEENKNVGVYEISIVLENDKNYNIQFIPATIEIAKKQITVNINSQEKVYGEQDPEFTYSFNDGDVVDGDVFVGEIIREEGENIGSYKLTSMLENPNYEIKQNEAYLTINKRDLNVYILAKDKVYDGTNDVFVMAEISNIAFEDQLEFNINATFENKYVGNNKKIIYTYSLIGEQANNYNVVVLNEPKANITNKTIHQDNVTVTVEDDNTSLTEDVLLSVTKLPKEELVKIDGTTTISGYIIKLTKNNETLTNFGKITVEINIADEEFDKLKNLQLYSYNNGSLQKIECLVEDGKIIFETTSLGEFMVVEKNETSLGTYILIGLGSFVGLVAIIGIIVYIVKRKRL